MEKNEYSIIDNYIFQNDIGEGNFGKVKLCIFKKTREKFAVKIMNKKRIELIMKNKIFRENKIITKFHHLNVISVFEIIEDLSNYYIIMEYCEKGELFEYILSHQKLTENECSLFFYQIINGVAHIHSRGVAHRDLKPENILLTDKNILKIIDFGLSHEFNETSELLNTKCGSPSYASPEIILGKEYDGFKSDIWSCGIILYAMATGYLPFEGENNKILFREILECNPDIPIYLSDSIHNLISSILTKNPDERISIENIKKHEFYLKGKKLFEKKYKNIFEIKNNVKILNEKEKKNFEKNTKENIIKNIVNKDYNIEEEEKSNENVEMNFNNKNSNHKIKNKKNNEENHKNKIKFINTKNTIINFKNKIMNINLNFNKKIESLNEKMNHILSTDANTIIANKINNNPIYFSIINNMENNNNKDTSINNRKISTKTNKNLETKINICNNINKQMEAKVKLKNKKSKLELHKRNKITNITPFLKTSETSPTSTKLPSYGRGDTSSEKVFSLKSNTRTSSSKHSINNNDTYRINSKSNNQRLNSQNNIELINKFNYYLIGKKTIPKNKNSKRTRIIGCKKKNFKSFKSHNSNNQIPLYNYKSNFTTTTNNSHSNNKNNSSSDDNSQFKKLFTNYNNYNNNKKIQRKKLLNKISLSVKDKSSSIIKNVRSIKSIQSSNDKKNNQKKENKNKIKANKQNLKNKSEFNKVIKLSEESIKSNLNILKSLINNNSNKKNNIQTKNLKKTTFINNYIYKNNNSQTSSFINKYQNKNSSINNNNIDIKKSSIMNLMQKNFKHMKTKKSLLQINLSYFNKNHIKKKINQRNSHKFYTNNNTYVNSITNLNSANNSIKKMFHNKENISFKYIPSENASDCKYSSRNNKHGKDILLTKIKDILKRRNKDVKYFLSSLNSVKSYKKKSFSNFVSRKGSSERSIKRINYSGLENNNNITVNCVYKYMSKYRNDFSKKNKKYLYTNLNLKTLKNTPSDFLSLYKKKLISY